MKLDRGTIYGLVGRNGSGKTMLMKCICGFVMPTSGEIIVQGKKIGRKTMGNHNKNGQEIVNFPESMGFIIENPGFLPYSNGYQNLKRLAELKHLIGKKEILHTLELVGLKDAGKKIVRKYSLGMRQRLAIAQAIMENPDILILDEPFNGLDEAGVRQMRKLLIELKEQGKLILLASHNKDDIETLCNHVFHIENGEITNT